MSVLIFRLAGQPCLCRSRRVGYRCQRAPSGPRRARGDAPGRPRVAAAVGCGNGKGRGWVSPVTPIPWTPPSATRSCVGEPGRQAPLQCVSCSELSLHVSRGFSRGQGAIYLTPPSRRGRVEPPGNLEVHYGREVWVLPGTVGGRSPPVVHPWLQESEIGHP